MSTIRYLRTFIAVSELGSFAAAAERVALSQAAVGQQMRALEMELHKSLFDRSQRLIVLSPEGRAMLPYARRLLENYDALLASDLDQSDMAGTIKIGTIMPSLGLLASCRADLKKRYPSLDIKVFPGRTREFPNRLQSGEIDAAICIETPHVSHENMQWTRLYEEPLVLLASSSLEAGPNSALTLLRNQPLIRFDPSVSTGAKIDQVLRRHYIKPVEVLEINSSLGIAELVRQNIGVALLPLIRFCNWEKDPALRVIPLPGTPPFRHIGLLESGDRMNITSVVRRHLQARLA